MTNFEDGSYSSAAGINLIAKVLSGRCTMRYTRAAVGKGKIPEGESPKTMTAPADYVMDARITGISNPINGECQVTVQINSTNVETGFYLTNIVLYAEDPDLGEIPYTYLLLENGPEWIRPSSSVVGKLATFELIAAVGEVDSVAADIDPASFVTAETVERMIKSAAADIKIGPSEPAGENMFWFDTTGFYHDPNDPNVPFSLTFNLNDDTENSQVTAEINSVEYGIGNAAASGDDQELKITINQ